MINSRHEILKFKSSTFGYNDLVSLTGINVASARNLISKMIAEGLITSNSSIKDKRKRIFFLNWSYIVNKLKYPDEEYDTTLEILRGEKCGRKLR